MRGAFSSRTLGLGIILLFWAAATMGNYPAPFIDDLSYVGTALSMAKHGLYTNPYSEMMRAVDSGPGQLYLCYVPMESYVLAGWLKLFGISALSFRALFLLLALMCSLLLYRAMPITRLSWLAALVICLAVYGMLGGVGVRPDAVGLFFFLLGFDVWRTKSPLGFFGRNFALALALISYLNVAPGALCFTLFGMVYLAVIRQKSAGELAPYAVAAAAAYGACFCLFLLCIGGHLGGFLHSVALNSHMGASGVRERFQLFTPFGISKWVVVQAAFLAVVGLRLRRIWNEPDRREERFLLFFALLTFAGMGYTGFSSASGAHLWALACLLTLLGLGLNAPWSCPGWTIYAAIFAVTAYGHDHIVIQHLLADPMPPAAQRQALRERVEAMNPRRLYLDEYAIRELYGYNLPDNAFDYECSSTTGWGCPRTEADLPKNAVFVTSVGAAWPTALTPEAGRSMQTLHIFGVHVPAVIANPYQLEVYETGP
jgi:hypothetical protein